MDLVTTRKVKKKVQHILHPLSGFTVSYSPASDSVTLTLAGTQTFPTGGQITVVGGPTGGVAGARRRCSVARPCSPSRQGTHHRDGLTREGKKTRRMMVTVWDPRSDSSMVGPTTDSGHARKLV